jgi:hypothetical protein
MIETPLSVNLAAPMIPEVSKNDPPREIFEQMLLL